MRSVSKLFVMFVAIFIFVLSNSATFASAEESGCVSCHTNLKKLLKITSAIEASKPEAEEPAESKGEG
ncbi:MAG: hypothetical protein JRC90_03005 [Deltaproteobacteria bacterium]|nr:hypothetical protein [Deltaproteobacteria bacterium]